METKDQQCYGILYVFLPITYFYDSIDFFHSSAKYDMTYEDNTLKARSNESGGVNDLPYVSWQGKEDHC